MTVRLAFRGTAVDRRLFLSLAVFLYFRVFPMEDDA